MDTPRYTPLVPCNPTNVYVRFAAHLRLLGAPHPTGRPWTWERVKLELAQRPDWPGPDVVPVVLAMAPCSPGVALGALAAAGIDPRYACWALAAEVALAQRLAHHAGQYHHPGTLAAALQADRAAVHGYKAPEDVVALCGAATDEGGGAVYTALYDDWLTCPGCLAVHGLPRQLGALVSKLGGQLDEVVPSEQRVGVVGLDEAGVAQVAHHVPPGWRVVWINVDDVVVEHQRA